MKDIKLIILQEQYIKEKHKEKTKKDIALISSNFRTEGCQQEEILGEIGLTFMTLALAYKRDKLLRRIANYKILKNKDLLLKIINEGLPEGE